MVRNWHFLTFYFFLNHDFDLYMSNFWKFHKNSIKIYLSENMIILITGDCAPTALATANTAALITPQISLILTIKIIILTLT